MKETLKRIKRIHVLGLLLLIVLTLIPFHRNVRRIFESGLQHIRGKQTVGKRIDQFRKIVEKRLNPYFQKINSPFPPPKMAFLCFKQEKRLEVWVADHEQEFKLLKTYPILGLSGELGPKLKERDGQVPEGIYHIDSLNPNSMFHLSIRLNYPNDFDKKMGEKDKRKELGSDIMIHGNTCSAGCLAMGDQAAEDLFVLCALSNIDNVEIILSPVDFRNTSKPHILPDTPQWLPKLYEKIKKRLKKFPKAPQNLKHK